MAEGAACISKANSAHFHLLSLSPLPIDPSLHCELALITDLDLSDHVRSLCSQTSISRQDTMVFGDQLRDDDASNEPRQFEKSASHVFVLSSYVVSSADFSPLNSMPRQPVTANCLD